MDGSYRTVVEPVLHVYDIVRVARLGLDEKRQHSIQARAPQRWRGRSHSDLEFR
jgi:hypothetical protein